MSLDIRERNIQLYGKYGLLLTEKQRCYFEEYYLYDLSYAEIALNHNVSRNAVFDSLSKVLNILNSLEEKLRIIDKTRRTAELLSKAEQDELAKAVLEIWEE